MKRHAILIVDDEMEILRALTLTFAEDYEVFTASSATEALQWLEREDIALVLTDQRMPEMTGVELLAKILLLKPNVIRMILTGYTDTAAIIEAINQGHIYRYITKPWNRQELRITVKRALESYDLTLANQHLLRQLQTANQQLQEENIFLRQEISRELHEAEIIGESAAMQRVFESVRKVIEHSVTVLLTGETGTGKTLLARYIHYNGPRREKLFIEQNCGTIPEELLESELFGHKRGAFTGASHNRKGLFEIANGGTIFLDEISEMSPSLQIKLLQVLNDGQFRRVGENEVQQVDVRIIAATNKDLPAEISKNRFRKDLYYRLNVFPIHIPPLHERMDDLRLLTDYCIKKHSRKLNPQIIGISEEAMQGLYIYDYPGNVRELENLIERALILSEGPLIEAGEWLPAGPVNASNLSLLEQFERMEIVRLLEFTGGNLGLIAKELRMSRSTLWRRRQDYGISVTKVTDV